MTTSAMWPRKGGFHDHIADLATAQRRHHTTGETRVTRMASERPRAAGIVIRVSRVVVDVVLKPEISDPQGQAVLGALSRLGHDGVTSVRQGKHFVLEVTGTPDEAELKQIAVTLLAIPVIEDVELHIPTD